MRRANTSIRTGRRRGIVVLYLAVTLMAALLLASLAVDFGRVACAKGELQTAADAAARYAAGGISDGTYLARAVSAAGANRVDGTSVAVQAADVVTGNWSSGAFAPGGTPANAVQVTLHRSAAPGNPIPVLFAPGVAGCDVSATATSTYATGGPAYGIVGVSSAMLQNGVILTDSYNSAAGPYVASAAGDLGGVASNGNVTLNGTVTIKTNVYVKSGSTVGGNGTLNYGSKVTLAQPLSYPVANPGSASTVNNNAALTPYLSGGNFNMNSGTLHVPAGTYYMNSFAMNGGTLSIDGAATFYVNGNFTIGGGTVSVLNSVPGNFTVDVIASAGGNLNNQTSLCINLYCPTSPINVNGCANLYGSLIGSQLSVSGPCALHVDSSLIGGSGGTVKTVR